ncbi:MAG: UDP-N-acetylmuramoyl-L-alanyl-D-glutamate--2,6-diaminopimelate ligase [Nocardioidaceae bacterium]
MPARPLLVVPVPLAAVAAELGAAPPTTTEAVVSGVALSSGSVRPGDVYAALPGARTHGAHFAAAAVEAGAVAVVTDAEGLALLTATSVPVLVTDTPRARLGRLAALVYGHPAESFTLIGVTGTQGKTTTCQLMAAAAQAAGRRAAVIGTMGTVVDGRAVVSSLTTPEAPDLHALFAVMREQGVELCAMEVSSHALVMGRVDGVVFDLAVFTNFGRDHLDFHADVEDYFAAKAELFTPRRARRALVNLDDPALTPLVEAPGVATRTFSSTSGPADWTAHDVRMSPGASTFTLRGPRGLELGASTQLPGRFNVDNALGAIAAVAEVGAAVDAAVAGVSSVAAVPGRMERIDDGRSFRVVVDYAHKPDALAAALRALRESATGRLLVVLGAGGDRDQGKRPVMGGIAAELADVVVVTDDNPRTEDAATIRAAVRSGARDVEGSELLEIGNRREAIRRALQLARPGDTVLIAGKGHETGQEVAGTVHPFDDREMVRSLLAELAQRREPWP